MENRREIKNFAEDMEFNLSMKDEERGDSWKECQYDFFFERLEDEIKELKEAVINGRMSDIRREAADVGNFAMMIHWKALEDWSNIVAKRMEEANIDPPETYSRN